MTWTSPYSVLAFDLETDGPNPSECHIITAALVQITDGKQEWANSWVLQPRRDIDPGAAAIHGYTTERATKEGEPAADCLDVIAGMIGVAMNRGIPLVAFNAAFDITCFESDLARFELPTLTERLGRPIGPVLDPYVIDGHLSRRKGGRRLVDQCAFYSVDIAEAHEATADALAAARVLWRLSQYCTLPKVQKVMGMTDAAIKAHNAVGAMSLDVIHAAQIGWAKSRAESFRKHRARTGGSTDGIDGTWPVRK